MKDILNYSLKNISIKIEIDTERKQSQFFL